MLFRKCNGWYTNAYVAPSFIAPCLKDGVFITYILDRIAKYNCVRMSVQ